ncbi:MAG: hypothetical protein ACKOUR_05935, partial [Planctomycetota bacterium]
FDDTGSFTNNSPIVRGAFPTIISQLQTALPSIDLGFGVGRFEEYGNFAWEYGSGRPFILNQPIVAASTTGYLDAIQSALNRETPGYGGDGPETDIEALYQLVTGKGFDGNNNGSVLDSGNAGLASTQLNPGVSGDVPSFASFQADPANGILPAAGSVGGGGFRSGALPVILTATIANCTIDPIAPDDPLYFQIATGYGNLTLSGFEVANLTGGASNNTFTISRWNGTDSLVGGGGSDTVVATRDANFTLSDASLVASNYLTMTLAGIATATLTGGASNNSVNLSGWRGSDLDWFFQSVGDTMSDLNNGGTETKTTI